MRRLPTSIRRFMLVLGGISGIFALAVAASFLFEPQQPPDVVVAPPRPPSELTVDTIPEHAETAAQALEQLSGQLAAARTKPDRKSEIADILMRSADLLRETGKDREALAHFVEMQTLNPNPEHWQNREAVRKAIDLEAEMKRPEPERQQLREARELHRTAIGHCYRGRYLPAVTIGEKALGIRRQLLPDTHQDIAESMLLLGRLQANRGELYGQARGTLTLAIPLMRKTVGTDHPQYAACLFELAQLEDARGEFVEAQKLYRAALDVYRNARGKFSADYANVLARLARMHRDWWVTGAEGEMLDAMHIRETVLGSNHPDYADSLQDLGVLAFNCLRLENAKELFLNAKKIREMTLGPGHPLNAESLSWLGRALVNEVDLTIGHEYHRQAIALAEQSYGPDHPLVGRYLGNFAQMCSEENDFDRGDRTFERALRIRTKHGLSRHPDQGSLLRGRTYTLNEWAFGAIYWESREVDLRPIEQMYQDAIRFFESLPTAERLPDFAGLLLELAELYYIDEYRSQSRTYCRNLIARAKTMMEQCGALDSHPFYSTYLTAQSYAAVSEGDYATAKPILDQLVDYSQGRFGYAFPYKRLIGPMLRVGLKLHKGVRADALTKETITDFETTRDAERILTVMVQSAQSTPTRMGIMRSHSEVTSMLLTLVRRFDAPFDPYQQVLRYRGLVASAQAVDQFAYDRPELAPKLTQLRDARRNLTRTVYSSPAKEAARPAWLEQVYQLNDVKDDLEAEIAFRVREGTRERNLKSPSIAEVQAALPANTVLIEYCGYQHANSPLSGRGRLHRIPSLLAFVVRKDQPPVMVHLGARAEIEKAVQRWQEAVVTMQTKGLRDGITTAATELAERIWKPVAAHIGAADTLLIAPDGPVGFIPFAALPGKVPGRFLLEDYTIGYVPSGRKVADLVQSPPPTSSGLLAIGNIAYGDTSGSITTHPVLRKWSQLPGSELELKNIEQQFTTTNPNAPVTSLTGTTATATKFTSAVTQGPRYIHYAGHGYFAAPATFPDLSDGPAGRSGLFSRSRTGHPAVLRNQLLLSGLVLADSEQVVDRLFTAEQVGSLDLRATELVVLSACETGLGEVATAEGAMSLQRAFLTAGARAVVGTLWKVDDAATAVLMDEFYRNLWSKKQSKLQALRNAQLHVLRHPESVTAMAAFHRSRGLDTSRVHDLPTTGPDQQRTDLTLWAAFILTGDGR